MSNGRGAEWQTRAEMPWHVTTGEGGAQVFRGKRIIGPLARSRRQPEATVLYRVVARHLRPSCNAVTPIRRGPALPRFVRRELCGYLGRPAQKANESPGPAVVQEFC